MQREEEARCDDDEEKNRGRRKELENRSVVFAYDNGRKTQVKTNKKNTEL